MAKPKPKKPGSKPAAPPTELSDREMAMAIQVADQLQDRWWRLNNLYWIQDAHGQRVLFKCNPPQERFYRDLHFFNILLKARQWGGTTFIDLFILDDCLFNSNTEAGIIAHNREDAQKIFRRKVKYPFDNLRPGLRQLLEPIYASQSEYVWPNGSSLFVATSVRSGTVQRLHISEYGKICRKYPEKAEEIKTGSLNAVHAGSMVFIESTAEGAFGDFFERCKKAVDLRDQGAPLTQLDYKFHFVGWHQHPDYRMDPAGVIIPDELREYFEKLKFEHGIALTPEQMAWYAKKSEDMGEHMTQEFPSTWQEAFEKAIEGAYYAKQMTALRKAGRITTVPYDPALPVDTGWDFGLGDMTCISFRQRWGTESRFIDFYENSGYGLGHYVRILRDKPYIYGKHFMPHDAEARVDSKEETIQKRIDMLRELMPKEDLIVVPRWEDITDAIEVVRAFLPTCVFDQEHCADLITGLDAYRREWDDHLGAWKAKPLHDWASHREASLRSIACGEKLNMGATKKFDRSKRRRGGMAA